MYQPRFHPLRLKSAKRLHITPPGGPVANLQADESGSAAGEVRPVDV